MTTTSIATPPVSTAEHSVRDRAFVTALLGMLVLGATAYIAVLTHAGQHLDESSMEAVVAGRDAELKLLSVLGQVAIGAILVMAAAAMVALARGRARLAGAAVMVIVGANVTTQVFKAVLDRPALGVTGYLANSLPSGHTTMVASGAGALVLVSPVTLRMLTAGLGALATALTGASTIVAGWHRPADIVAACAVALTWTAIAALVVGGERPRNIGTLAGSLLGSVVAVSGLVIVGVRPLHGWPGFTHAFLVLLLVTLVTALMTTAMAAVSPRR